MIKRSQSGTGDWAVSGGTSENDTVSGMGINSLDEVVIAASLSASGTRLQGDDPLRRHRCGACWHHEQQYVDRPARGQHPERYAFDLTVNMSDEAIMVGGFGGSITQGGTPSHDRRHRRDGLRI